MRHLLCLFVSIASALIPFGATAVIPSDIVDSLRSAPAYSASARFTVSMPQLSDDVVYSLDIRQIPEPADTILGLGYLVDWHSVSGTPATIEGFSAYCPGGHHYRFNGHRLQEYHFAELPEAFISPLGPSKGVHLTAQYISLLPFAIADELERMIADTAYTVIFHPDTLIGGRRVCAVCSVLSVGGVTAQEAEYVFSPDTYMPLRVRLENSPGTISEQSVEISYIPRKVAAPVTPVTDQTLAEAYPEVFATMRQSNFRFSSLPGTRLPAFALPTSTRERYSRGLNDSFRAPTIVVMLSAADAMSGPMVSAVRQAVDSSPAPADVIWVVAEKDTDAAESTVGLPREGEHLLINGRSLMRDCAAADLPALLLCDTAGVIRYATVGFNNQLASDVIQMLALF